MSRCCIVSMAMGPRYQPLLARLIKSLHDREDPVTVISWANTLPPGAPTDHPLPYLAYCAKPFAMLEAVRLGYEVILWLDSACYAIRHTGPFFAQIEHHGYYAQDNGFWVGEWCSDKALVTLDVTREVAFAIPEVSTMAVGLDVRRAACRSVLDRWAELAADGVTFLGAHTNDIGPAVSRGLAYRATGHVSDDPRVLGARHDQTAFSVLAWRVGWARTPRPIHVDYAKEVQDERTIIVNKG